MTCAFGARRGAAMRRRRDAILVECNVVCDGDVDATNRLRERNDDFNNNTTRGARTTDKVTIV